MRTEPSGRTFPYVCHTVRPTRQGFLAAIVGVLWAVAMFAGARDFAPMGSGWVWTYYSLAVIGAFAPVGAILYAGYIDMLPNRVHVIRGETVVRAVTFSPAKALGIVAGWAIGTFGFANTFLNGPFSLERWGVIGILTGPAMLGFGVYMIGEVLWQRLRRIRMTPVSLTYWRGFGRITLDWDELGDIVTSTDIRDHEPGREHFDVTKHKPKYLPGAKIAIPAERASATRLPTWTDPDGVVRLLLDTEHFRVEPSALLTAIIAMRDHPELREKLGTRESKTFFVGPPWRVRRHMYRNQQWWPKGAAPDGVEVDADGVVKEPVPRLELS